MHYDIFAYAGIGLSAMAGTLAGLTIYKLISTFLTQITMLEERIATLEEAQATRLPHRGAAGIEDALAVLLDLERSIDDEQLDIQARKQRISRAMRILQIVRKDPDGYDIDEPNGAIRRRTSSNRKNANVPV